MNKRSHAAVGILLGLVLFFAVNVLAGATLRTMRLDLTEEHLYTLSEGSRRIARDIEEPIHLYLYVSEDVATNVPSVQSYAQRVRELLEEYELRADGNIVFEVVDPEPFSEEEDRARAAGLQAVPIANGDALFLGLVGTNAVGDTQIIPFFNPSRERFLEYDVAQLIYTLAHPDKRVVAFISSLPLQGGPPDPMNPRGQQGWQIVEQIRQLSEVRFLEPTVEEIPDDVDVLFLVHPKNLGEKTLYAIDQYVLGGGKAIVYVDPFCEADQSGSDPMNPMAGMQADKSSNLQRLFTAWGIEMVPDKFVADRANALQVSLNSGGRPRDVEYVAWLELESENLDSEDAVTSLLSRVRFATAGVLQKLPDAETDFEPLAWTSEESMLLDVSQVQFMPDPEGMLAGFVPEYEQRTLVARVSGDVESAFPDGPPAAPESAAPEAEGTDGQAGADEAAGTDGQSADEGAAAEEEAESGSGHLAASTQPIQVVVVSDVDTLQDRFWIQEERLLGQISLGYRKTADDGDLAINAVENLAGGEDLISIRAQGKYQRPFTRVEEIRRDAEQRYLQEEQELERKLQTIESRINDMQFESDTGNELILSAEQQKELDAAREEMLATKKKLRDVQHSLRKDIESLGNTLKWLNVLLVPALVAATALALGAARVRRRTQRSS